MTSGTWKLYTLLLIFLIPGCESSDNIGEIDIDSDISVLSHVFPEDELPSNGSLILLIYTPHGAVDPDTIEVTLNGIEGNVEGAGSRYIWKTDEPLPLGPAKISIKGESISGQPIEVKNPSLLEITVVSPDNTPPALVNSLPENGAIDIDADRFGFDILITYSEVVKWFDAKVEFEPNIGLKGSSGEVAEIDFGIYSSDYEGFTVQLKESSKLSRGTSYTITLSNMVDVAGNSGGDQRITFTTR